MSTATGQSFLSWLWFGPNPITGLGTFGHNVTMMALGGTAGVYAWKKWLGPMIHRYTDPTGEKRIASAEKQIRRVEMERSQKVERRSLPRHSHEVM
jgi:hypothetical protein